MAIFNTRLGMNIKNNPIQDSPFVVANPDWLAEPPYEYEDLLTETGLFILTETDDFITTG